MFLFLALAAGLQAAPANRIQFSWPTPNPAWEQGKGYEAWAQATVSGDPESGLFGCVRSSGNQFHEGLDIRPIRRDRHGEPADPVMAAMDGVVRYVNLRAGDSSYGRYIVIEHTRLTPAVYTLYAHLARVEPGIKAWADVKRGQVIGLMGHTAGGYAIPKERAHVHFEIGVVATTNFASWYAWKRFGSPNEHGVFNGMNLMGIDPNDFLREYRRGRIDNFQEYFDTMRAVVRVRVATRATPDFIERYPSLLRRPLPPDGRVAGWEVECNATGLPFAWTPLGPAEVAGMAPGTARIVAVDRAAVRAYRCKHLIRTRGGHDVPDSDLAMMLQLVFGLR